MIGIRFSRVDIRCMWLFKYKTNERISSDPHPHIMYSANKKFWDSWNSTVTIFHLSWFELVSCIMYIYCATSYVILIERNKISSCEKKSSLENSSRSKSSGTPLVGLNRWVVGNLKNTIEESMKSYPIFISFPFRTNL